MALAEHNYLLSVSHEVFMLPIQSNTLTSTASALGVETPKQDNNDIQALDNAEFDQIYMTFLSPQERQLIARGFFYDSFYRAYLCSRNVLETLKVLPNNVVEKMKVIIFTHERNGYIKNYAYYTCILVKATSGMRIFDPGANKEDEQSPSANFGHSGQRFRDHPDSRDPQFLLT